MKLFTHLLTDVIYQRIFEEQMPDPEQAEDAHMFEHAEDRSLFYDPMSTYIHKLTKYILSIRYSETHHLETGRKE